MSKTKINIIGRTALWRANDQRCFYCKELVSFRELEIDHVIAETTPPERLTLLVEALALGADFDVNCIRNLVPAHNSCNRKKSDTEFSESSLRFYLETWRAKRPTVEKELNTLKRESSNDRLLSTLASRIEAGHLTLHEVTGFLENLIPAPEQLASPREPWIVTFGLNIDDLFHTGRIPPGAPENYAQLCDYLEEKLLFLIRQNIPSLSVQTEASARSGETLSVRMAFWNLDMRRLDVFADTIWEIIEVAPYSEIYESDWNELFPQAVVETYHGVLRDDNDADFNLARCPQCGSNKLDRSSATNYEHDKTYNLIRCMNCEWTDWTE
jgi:hypothetical protein